MRGLRTRSVVVGADAKPELQGLARGVGPTLGIGGLLVFNVGRWRADEGAKLLARGGVLQRALRLGGHAVWHVDGARLEERALWRAEVAADSLDGHLSLVGKAARLGVGVVRRLLRRRRARRARRARRHGLDAGWVRSLVGQAAHVLVARHPDEASLAPRRAPRVLDLPKIHARVGISAVADDEHAVIKLLSAERRVEDARLVELEGRLVRLNGHRDGALGHRVLQRNLVVLRHVFPAGQRHHGLAIRLAHAGDTRA
mmetsp:Transcript_2336/g.4841  ORF Transcript_2336/g.4841 Transcript_2336/m.4841 type:complete len:257 (-) Transcript_2336:655-1425(-)